MKPRRFAIKEDLRTVIANFRRDLNLNGVPFLLGELGDFYEEKIQKNVPDINGIMHELSQELNLFASPLPQVWFTAATGFISTPPPPANREAATLNFLKV